MQHIIFFMVLAYSTIVPGSRGRVDDVNTNLVEEISMLKSLLLEINSRLQNVEIKNQALENENIRLKYQMEDIRDINEDLRHHITSSDIHFGVIEQNFDNYVSSSDIKFAEISDRIDQNKNTTDQNLNDYVERSESHFLEIDGTLSPIGTITAWIPKVDLEAHPALPQASHKADTYLSPNYSLKAASMSR